MGNDGPGRPQSVTANQLFNALFDTREPKTANELAEMFDTTAKTVRKRVDELLEYQGICSKDVGPATVYWYSMKSDSDDDTSDLEAATADYARQTHKDRAAARGVWLNRREHILSNRASAGMVEPDSVAIYHRLDLCTALAEYIDAMELTWPRVLEDAAFGEGDALIDLDEWDIDEDTYHYYTEEMRLSYQGETVQGMGDLFTAVEETQSEAGSEISDSPGEEIDVERFDKVLPGFEELLHAADAFDEFVCEMHGYGWGR